MSTIIYPGIDWRRIVKPQAVLSKGTLPRDQNPLMAISRHRGLATGTSGHPRIPELGMSMSGYSGLTSRFIASPDVVGHSCRGLLSTRSRNLSEDDCHPL